MIGILDLNIGNLKSVFNAVYELGFDPKIISQPSELPSCDRLIMPGVGSFQRAMQNLTSLQFQENLANFKKSGKPILGLCVGLQIMAQAGEEGGADISGLGWLSGNVRKFPSKKGFPVPHVGWNDISVENPHPVLKNIKSNVDFYFVHSYRFNACNSSEVLASTNYDENFPSILGRENYIGFQFHPEKSQINGLRLLENFCQWMPSC